MRRRESGKGAVVLAVGATITGGLPVFLLGALFVQIQRDIPAPQWVLGAAVASYWGAAAMMSLLAGRVVSWLGIRSATLFGVVIGASSLIGGAFLVPSWVWLLVWAAVGGVCNGISHPAANQLINLRVRRGMLATAFGIKQSAIPFAAFLAGLAVPALALTLGWHWGFGLAGLFALAVGALFWWSVPRGELARPRLGGSHVPLTPPLMKYLLLMASVTTLSAAATGAVTAYAVITGIERGLPLAGAGILLSVAGLLSVVVRVIVGRIADRANSTFALATVAAMMFIGGGGVLLMAVDTQWTFVAGMLLALGIGWGWPGLTHFVVSRVAGPATPSATGVVQIGTYVGSGAGPLAFGLLFVALPQTTLWIIVGAVQIVAGYIAFVLARKTPPAVPVS
ncbi:MFS transporter [Cryobacterium gelidum]|uniref:MFS transporter n=1 Tax=Cryobacterium gelidum TaxID=1259164 RepID=A0A4R9AZ50_9MICO|nr:MFS transporter [Cryobacterium gelidum]TFD73208.1 MFS transporter [Cryobacterium gelidum]